MKKIYERPTTKMVQVDTCCICAASPNSPKWVVDKTSDEDYDTESPHWGPIHYDGDGTIDKKNDPFDSENW